MHEEGRLGQAWTQGFLYELDPSEASGLFWPVAFLGPINRSRRSKYGHEIVTERVWQHSKVGDQTSIIFVLLTHGQIRFYDKR